MPDDLESLCDKLAREALNEAGYAKIDDSLLTISVKSLHKWISLGAERGFGYVKSEYLDNPTRFPKCLLCARKNRKLHNYGMNQSMLTVLREIAEFTVVQGLPWVGLKQDGGFYVLPDGTEIQSKVPQCRRRAENLVFFEFVECVKNENQYRAAQKGMDFLASKIKSPLYIRSRDGEAEEVSDELIWVHEVKGVKTDWKYWVKHATYAGKDPNATPVKPSST